MRSLHILRLLILLLLAPALLPLSGSTVAAPREDTDFAAAEALYNAGEFEAALAAARALDTPDGFALASRAGLVLMRYFMPPAERPAAIEAALADARRALDADPEHLEGNLEAAISIGYRGKLTRSMGDAWAGKKYIDTALLHHPDSAWAEAVLGGWNGEVVMEAGRFFAGMLFGAKRKRAVQHFRAGLAIEPENIAIRTGFAITLLRFNRSRFEKEAIELLSGTIALDAEYTAENAAENTRENALDEILVNQSRELLGALQEGRREDLRALLQRLTTFADR
ncbi:MAG: hypothetical protein IID51_02010 [Proteobacteria bacterium]|nr:hypothetical protein [Pseudomonadota bacterium]